MSLINDLLIELDRESESESRSASRFMDGMEPRARREPKLHTAASAFAIVATLAFIATGIGWIVATPSVDPAVTEAPAVSARPEPTIDRGAVGPTSERPSRSELALDLVHRPLALRTVSLSKRGERVRLTLSGDTGIEPRVERSVDSRGLEITFSKAVLHAPLDDLDLIDTPIRSISTKTRHGDLQIALGLDEPVRIQTQSLSERTGAKLIIDLQPASSSRRDRAQQASVSLDPSPSFPASIPTETLLHSTDDRSRPTEMDIARSAPDRIRNDLARSHARATQEVEAARIARAEGDFDRASALYESAVALAPGHREAVMDWSALLTETDRASEAIDLVRRARKTAPGDAGLAMLHAQLIEKIGRREDAILILDRAGFSLTESPEIHALAAAYLQRAGAHDQAIERYETIVRRYPGESRWWMGLGISLEAQSRAAEAIDVYRIAMQIGELSRTSRQWVASRVEALDQEG